MAPAYQIESICEVFGAACEHFESLIDTLSGESAAQMEHGQIETLLSRMGNELMRLLMQAHLDLRAEREERRHDLAGPEGQVLCQCREHCERDLMTVFAEGGGQAQGLQSPKDKKRLSSR